MTDNANSNKDGNKNVEKPKPAAVSAEATGEVAKDDNRGGRPRGKDNRHGERPHKKGESQEDSEKPRRQKREFERRSGTGRLVFRSELFECLQLITFSFLL